MARPAKLLPTNGCKSRRGKWTTPRSGLQCEEEILRAKRSVESLLSHAGSKTAARSASEPLMTPRQIIRPKGLEKPSRACHGEGNRLRSPRIAEAILGEDPLRILPGYKGRDAAKADSGTGETLLDGPSVGSPSDKAKPKRERRREGVRGGHSTGEARTNNLAEGRASA